MRPQEVFQKLYQIFQKALKNNLDGDKFIPQANLKDDLGINSLDVVEIALLIERDFQINDIPNEEVAKFETVEDIMNYLASPVSPSVQIPAKLEYVDIYNILPHGPEFIMVDRVTSLNIDMNPPQIRATYNVSGSAWWARDHFPNNPTMPGNLILEGLCQTAGILAATKHEQPSVAGWVTGYSGKIRFKRQVIPGDTLKYYAEILKTRLGTFTFNVWAKVDGREVIKKFELLLSTPR